MRGRVKIWPVVTPMNPEELELRTDPGWGPAWRRVSRFWFSPWRARRREVVTDADGLAVTRMSFLTYCFALVALGVFAALRGSVFEATDRLGLVVVVVAVGLLGLAIAEWFGQRPLATAGEVELAGSYRHRFFVQTTSAQLPAFAGFAATVFGGPWTVYLIGFALSMVGFARLAPTVARLKREQEQLTAVGCRLSLVAALRRPRDSGRA